MAKFILVFIILLKIQLVHAQQIVSDTESDFQKIIEYNILTLGDLGYDTIYNLRNKPNLDRILFGNINSPIEFIFHPSGEMREEVTGLRMVKSDAKGYKLEIFYRPNADRILGLLATNTKEIALPYKLRTMKFLSLEGEEWIRNYNDSIRRAKFCGDIYLPYRIKPKVYNVSTHFFLQLHQAIVALIDGFQANGVPQSIMADGYSVTFRCIVENELRTLKISQPLRKAKQLSDVLRLLIADLSQTETIDESKYLELIKIME